ncbi:ion transporter [Aeromicrobium sp. NPDC092404]|uniref:ion transporter n=1 Tax=Aeromicrobium sp. NPDC092404 TaxID=3154976 RepID=UPI00341E4EDA
MPDSRLRVRAFVDSTPFQWFIIGVILVNAAILGLETSPRLMAESNGWLTALGWLTVGIFVVELGLRIYAYGRSFFRDGWSLFDLFVVVIALIPTSAGFGILRVLRVLRVLRLLSAVRSMRRVVAALVATIPGMASIGALLVMLVYVSGVMATQVFGTTDPDHFGDLPTSLLSLFQVMTGDDWAAVVRPVTDEHPWAWGFFILYILASTYIVLNLFIAVAVEALERQSDDDTREIVDEIEEGDTEILGALAELKDEVAALRAELANRSA